ncbi:MAG: hypothetical protein R3191_06820 [Anaerolineales bacterium]|nr:hypothetical protein [Anaerolineales bacterium]
MTTSDPSPASADLDQILKSAARLGVELDEAEALQWLSAMAAEQEDDVVFDERQGVFGHRISMLDFSAEELARFRRIGRLVEIPDQPGQVETALALSGSAAQSKIQSYPGDCDFFERVNILADTLDEACDILAEVVRDKALSAAEGPTHELIEVKFGSYPETLVHNGREVPQGSPISWSPEEIEAGEFQAFRPDGNARVVTWHEASRDSGWVKLDWVVADPERGQLANASNMLDVTWQSPQGEITPLDGYLDPYFQEVYLEAESIPIFSKLADQVDADALDEYVDQLEAEVHKYISKSPNYGKAAKRMYNVFRLTGLYTEAAYVRELFDEPASLLYQVGSLIRTLDDVAEGDHQIPRSTLISQADELILSVVDALEGDQERELVRELLKLKSALTEESDSWSERAQKSKSRVMALVNTFFKARLTAVPSIQVYMKQVGGQQTDI